MDSIRVADERDFSQVRSFYWKLIDDMRDAPFFPGWQKGIYPSDDFLRRSLKADGLYVLTRDDHIAAAMILNHACNEGYAGTDWCVAAPEDEITVVHALGVLPEFHGCGLAKAMVRETIRLARKNRQKAIRLDVLSGNRPALELYKGLGFQYRRSVQMYYEDTGWTDYLLFELPL